MRATVVSLVTPHLLRVVDLANEAEKGGNVDWHLRYAVFKTMASCATSGTHLRCWRRMPKGWRQP